MSQKFEGYPELQKKYEDLSRNLIPYSRVVQNGVIALLEWVHIKVQIERRKTPQSEGQVLIITNTKKLLGEILDGLGNTPEWREFFILYPKLEIPVQRIIANYLVTGPDSNPVATGLIHKSLELNSDFILARYSLKRLIGVASLLASLNQIRIACNLLLYLDNKSKETLKTLQ